MRTFSVQTLGCKVNQYESEQLAALLRARGLQSVEPGRENHADLHIINTCSVTREAAAKSGQLSRRAARGRGPTSLPQLASPPPSAPTGPICRTEPHGRRVVVTGCWATSDRAAAETIPGVDAVIGHHQDVAAELIGLLDLWQARVGEEVTPSLDRDTAAGPLENKGWINHAGSPAGTSTPRITLSYGTEVNEKMGKAVLSSGTSAPRGTTALPLLSSRQTGRQRAHLKIQDGCDAHCTYCIIPNLRPALWSKPIADVVAEANQLVAAGHVEIVLTGIFLGAYGHTTAIRRRRETGCSSDEAAAPKRSSDVREISTHGVAPPPGTLVNDAAAALTPLARLADALCSSVAGLKRLRFSSLEPGDLDDDLIAVLRNHRQVVPHFHLPLQSGSDLLLRRMNRQYTRQDYLRMVDKVREAFDRPALTTDIIVGFPGEADAEFERTLEVVRHCRFIHIHAFPFSPRPGTAAARWSNHFVPGGTVNARIGTLRQLSEADSLAYRREFIGETVELLVEREKDEAKGAPRQVPSSTRLRHGRAERYFPVHFEDPSAQAGNFVRVKIDRVDAERTLGTRIP